MARERLDVGERGSVHLTAQRRQAGKWVATVGRQKAERVRARARYRDHAGLIREVCRYGATRHEAEKALNEAIDAALSSTVEQDSRALFVEAGRLWLAHMRRQSATGAGVSPGTADLYEWTFGKYIDADGSLIRGMSLAEANNPQRLRRFLQDVADRYGTGSAKTVRTIVSAILKFGVRDGVLTHNAMRDVEPVRSTIPVHHRKGKARRDTTRAFTRPERDRIVAHADALATETDIDPRTTRKRQTAAELVAFMAGTGVRISEARSLQWTDVDLDRSRAEIRGTKTKFSHRSLTLPVWLARRLELWKRLTGGVGYVFASPTFVDEPRRMEASRAGVVQWEESNCHRAVRAVLDSAGFEWATGHSFRRTVATLAAEGGAPLAHVADQLGHADPTMTATVYLGRDPFGERRSVAEHL